MKWGFKGTKEMAMEIIRSAFGQALWHPRIRNRIKPDMEIQLHSGSVDWNAGTNTSWWWDYGEIRWNIRLKYKGKEFGTSGSVRPYHGTADDDIEAIKERWIRETMWDMIARIERLLDYIDRLEEQKEV